VQKMKILFDCASYYGGPPAATHFVVDIFAFLVDIYRKEGHECHIATVYNKEPLKIRPDIFFVWNGESKASRAAAAGFGCPVIYAEKAWLPADKDHFYFDMKGVNFSGTLKDWKFEKPLNKYELERLAEYLIDYRMRRLARPDSFFGKKYVLLPLQVEEDSQIKLHSPFKRMQDFINYAAERLPDKTIYVKPHPASAGLRAEDLRYPANCKLVRGPIHNLIRNAEFVVTINSTVGVEALSYYKPVIVLGNAFYGNPDMTHPIRWASAKARSPENKKRRVPLSERRSANRDAFGEAVKSCEKEGRFGIRHKEIVQSYLYWLIFKRQWTVKDFTKENALGLLEGRVEKNGSG